MSQDQKAWLLSLTVELQIPAASCLKSKRKVIKSLLDRIRSRFNASAAEIACLDKWQRSVVGIVMLSNNRKKLEADAAKIREMVAEYPELICIGFASEWL